MGKKKLSRYQKILITSIALITGLSCTVVSSSLLAYNTLFTRYERPNYVLHAGNYYYERMQNQLYREEFYFTSNKERLKGYFYPALYSKGLVVVSHGYHAGADDYLPIIQYLVNANFSVFAYDMTGTYDSGGDGLVGWCQSLIDLDYALKHVSSREEFNRQPLFLLGHSWGGYAVTSVLALHKNVKACAAIAPMNNASTIMVEKIGQYVGKFANLPKPVIDAYQKYLFKDYVEHNGVKGINSVDIPVLIAHGVDDEIITYNKQSITSHKDKIKNPNVIYYDGIGLQAGHSSILLSKEAVSYQKQIDNALKLIQNQKGNKLTVAEQISFFDSVDHALFSQVNEQLMSEIVVMFNKTI